jgi:hypothetical protein
MSRLHEWTGLQAYPFIAKVPGVLNKAAKDALAQFHASERGPDVDAFYLGNTRANASKPTHAGQLVVHPY